MQEDIIQVRLIKGRKWYEVITGNQRYNRRQQKCKKGSAKKDHDQIITMVLITNRNYGHSD